MELKYKGVSVLEMQIVFVIATKAANNPFLCFLVYIDVAEGDPDADCRSLAVQSLVLLDKSMKKQLQDPEALSLES